MLRELYYMFLPYRSMVYPFLVAAAVAVPLWVVFRVIRLRSRRKPVSVVHEILLLVFVIYLAGLASATLTPNRSSSTLAAGRGGVDLRPSLASLTCSASSLPSGSSQGFCVRNARGNAMLFFPLGLLLPLIWRRLRFRNGVLIAIGVSVSIELLQYLSSALGSYRAVDVNDSILNVLGASLGLALVFLLRWRPGGRRAALPA